MLKRIAIWLIRGWPILSALPLLVLHLLLLELPWWTAESFNKYVMLFMQVLGGYLILNSIDSNLGTFKKNGLLSLFKSWIRDFPSKNDLVQIHSTGGVASTVSSGEASSSYKQTFATVEETLKYLQDQIDEIQKRMFQDKKVILKKLDEAKDELRTESKKIRTDVDSLTGNLESIAVGGIKSQLFGFMLLIYSACITFLS